MEQRMEEQRMDFPPFLRCSRTGNGDWRCNSMVAPGRSYCARHYEEQKVRNQRKRHRKLLLLSNKKKGSDEEASDEGEGEGSETEYLMKRVLPAAELEATDRESYEEDGGLIGSPRKKMKKRKQNCGDQEGRGRRVLTLGSQVEVLAHLPEPIHSKSSAKIINIKRKPDHDQGPC